MVRCSRAGDFLGSVVAPPRPKSTHLMSPAAEAFRYFVLEQGEAFLAKEYGHLVRLDASVEAP